ncbi:hypothetical protein JWG45_17270 [Leptospira sp. 201903070]|uniref:HNH endonuclease 5 domain-containing protein n=1 Tax=Leptospira ainlahdjerensis TaxID=2810033 RepID=A0ABS2UGI0_9LEPT|nr:HNH endonuclease [Leptospira ainlahdjerensis]MBM9578899.1 hypothetical protein [Leptospira ainlahdjerensis]
MANAKRVDFVWKTKNKWVFYLEFTILSEKDRISFGFEDENNPNIPLFTKRFFLALDDSEIDSFNFLSFNYLQTMSTELLNRLRKEVSQFAETNPSLNRVVAFLKRIPSGTHFYILPFTPSLEQLITYNIKLKVMNSHPKLNQEETVEFVNEEVQRVQSLIGHTIENFEIIVANIGRKFRYGEFDRAKRICRFCNGTTSTGVTFNSEAHLIPEGIGNKYAFNNEECDECNINRFGPGIEKDFLEFFAFFRLFYRIRGKENFETWKYRDARVSTETGTISITIQQNEIGEIEGKAPPETVSLQSFRPIKYMNLYRALAKFAIGLIPAKFLPDLSTTIDWINGNQATATLPHIAICINTGIHFKNAQLTLYIRKETADKKLWPRVFVELHFGSIAIIFILPFFDVCEDQFITPSNFQDLLKRFRQYQGASWNYWDLNNDIEAKYEFQIDFQKNGDS